MFAFPAAPSRDIGEKGQSGQSVRATIKRRQACFSELSAADARVYSQTYEKNGEVEGFLVVFENFPPQRTTRDSIPQTSPPLGTRQISKPDTPTTTPHKVSHWNLCGLQKNILQTRRKARSFFLFSPVFRPAACKRFHWAEKVLLARSANLVPSMIHNVVRSPACL